MRIFTAVVVVVVIAVYLNEHKNIDTAIGVLNTTAAAG